MPMAVQVDHDGAWMHATRPRHRGVNPRLIEVPEGLEREVPAGGLKELAVPVELPTLQPIDHQKWPTIHPLFEGGGNGQGECTRVGVIHHHAAGAGSVRHIGGDQIAAVRRDENERHRAVLVIDPGGNRQRRRR